MMVSQLRKVLLLSILLCGGFAFADAEKEVLMQEDSQKIATIDPQLVQQLEEILNVFVKEGLEKSTEEELKVLGQKMHQALTAVKAGDQQAISEFFYVLSAVVKVMQQQINYLERENRLLRVSFSLKNNQGDIFDTLIKYVAIGCIGSAACMMIATAVITLRDAFKRTS